MYDALIILFLYILFNWVNKKVFKKKDVDGSRAYIRELKVELGKYQANSKFLAKTLIEREIEKQRGFIDSNSMFIQ